jgi:hypothetical protein|nr:MAG TPA: hypothetical protein [Crassvirales sp.]
MGFLDKLRTYAGSWSEAGREKLSKAEVAQVESAKVVEGQYGLSMCFLMKAGGKKFMPLSRDSQLEEGDSVDIKSVDIITLERDGDDDIYRADGTAM